MKRKSLTLSLVTILLLCADTQPLLGVTSNWISTVDGNWNVGGNWSNGVPGLAGIAATDTATFNNSPPSTLTVNLDINSGLNVLSFISSGNYTISPVSSNSLYFNPISALNPSIVLQGSGSQTINTPIRVNTNSTLNVTANQGSTLTFGGLLTATSGSANFSFSGPGTMSIDSASNGQGIILNGSFTQTSGVFNIKNNLAVIGTNGSRVTGNAGFTIQSGATYNAENSGTNSSTGLRSTNTSTTGVATIHGSVNAHNFTGGTITGNNARGVILQADSLVLDGAYYGLNEGPIPSNLGTGNVAVDLSIDNGPVNISGTLITENQAAIGNISNTSGDVGSRFVAFNVGATTLSGTLSVINSGVISGRGRGALASAGSFVMNGGTATLTNSGMVQDRGTGSSFQFRTTASISNGTVNLTNSGSLKNNATGCLFTSFGYTQSGGVVTLNNLSSLTSQGVSDPVVACNLISSGPFTMTGGTLNAVNNGALIGESVGTVLNIFGGMTISGGQQTYTNLATTSDDSAGSAVFINSGGNFLQSGGTVSLDNKGSVLTNTANGILFFASGNSTINQGTFSSLNEAEIFANAGNLFSSGGNLIQNNGTLIGINKGQISGPGSSSGSVLGSQLSGTNFSLNGGICTLSNIGRLTGSYTIGSVLLGRQNVQINGGNLTLSNTGDIDLDNSIGAFIQANQTFTIAGGNVYVTANQGRVSSPTSCGNLLVGGTQVIVNGGLLRNNDHVRSPLFSIGPNGIVKGSGVYTGLAAAQNMSMTNAGKLTPGDLGTTNGVMRVGGSYLQTSTGTLNVEILSAQAFSQLKVLGASNTATLNGELLISFLPGARINAAETYKIVVTDNPVGVINQFSSITNASSYRPIVEYFSDYALLTLIPSTPTIVGNFTSPLITSINETNFFLGKQMVRLKDRVREERKETPTAAILSDTSSFLASNDLSDSTVLGSSTVIEKRKPWNVYMGPTGHFGKISSTGTQPGFDYWSAGALAGFDYAFSNGGVGFLADYDYIKSKQNAAGKFIINEAHGSLYGTISPKQLAALSFNGIVGGSYEWYEIDDAIGSDTQKSGTPSGGEFDALFGIEYTLASKDRAWKLVPLVSLQYVYLHVGSYEDSLYNVEYDSQTIQSLRSALGSRLNYTWMKSSTFKLVTELDFAWQREFMNHNFSTTYSSITFVQPSSTIVVPGSGRNIFIAGIDLQGVFKDKYTLEANYDFEWNSEFVDNSFYLGVGADF